MDIRYLQAPWKKYRQYASQSPDPLGDVIHRHREMRRTRLIDLAAVASSLAYVDRDELDALALKAIQDTNPGFDPSRIHDYTDAQWMGMVNAAKGKYFEYLVVERLNAGEVVGDLYLTEGHSAVLAESANQAGWDVRIVDEQGNVVEYLQLKATESAGYLRDTLDRYPEIRIVSTEEAAHAYGSDGMVIDSGITESDLEQTVRDTFDGLAPGTIDQFWEAFNPLIPMVVIAATQGYRVVLGRQRVRHAVEEASQRAARGVVAAATGAAVKVLTDSLLMAAPASILAGFWFDRARNLDAMAEAARKQSDQQHLRLRYLRGELGAPE